MGDEQVLRWQITEVEAYDGPEDRACHAHKGRTQRTEIMFAPGGAWYVYLCYGVHWLVNIVTGPADYPSAVLLRGAGELAGPGRLSKSIGIDGSFNRLPANVESGLWIEAGSLVPGAEVWIGPRVGVDYAGQYWAARPWRWIWTSQWAGDVRKLGMTDSKT